MIKTPLSTVIGGAFWTPGATIIGSSSKNLTQIIKSIFSVGGQGFAYDPNDLTTLFQDAAGTIPVTAAGQPVGLMLDKSKPITNTSILDSTFLLADGWIKSNPAISVTNVGGSLRVSKGTASPNNVYRPFSCESGKLYRLTVKYKNHTGNNVRFFVRNANSSGVNLVLSQSILTFTNTDGTHNVLSSGVEIGTDVEYGAIHHFGGEIKYEARMRRTYFRQDQRTGLVGNKFVRKARSNFMQESQGKAYKVNMPRRPFLGLTETDEQEVLSLIVEHLTGE